MPSSVTLTVAHLPTSTSFFLSALQPLDYVYRGRSNNTIGFGSGKDRTAPADFWITQEIPGVPAGAAHVAFPAASHLAVQHFFTAALKAGGKIHGEPTVRDSSGYYSAAVIDFDGNSIEAVYRPTFSDDKENDIKSVASNARSKAPTEVRSSVSRAPPSEVRTTASRAAPPTQVSNSSQRKTSGDRLEQLIGEARNAADMARKVVQNARPATAETSNGASDVVMGTLLGVAAGAALHYVMTEKDKNRRRFSASGRSITEPALPTQYTTYRAIEDGPGSYYSSPRLITLEDNDSASTVRPASHYSRRNSGGAISTGFGPTAGSTASRSSRQTGVRMIEAAPRPPSSFKSPSHVSATPSRRNGSLSDPLPTSSSRSRTGSSLQRSESRSSRRGSVTTVVRATESHDRRSPSSTTSSTRRDRDREPASYPLPPSRASTWNGDSVASRSKSHHSSGSKHSKAKESIFDREVTPADSISQVSVNTQRSSAKSSRRR